MEKNPLNELPEGKVIHVPNHLADFFLEKMKEEENDRHLYSLQEACEYFGIVETTLLKYVRTNEIGHIRMFNKTYFTPEHLQDFAKKHEVKPKN